jgi:hypothetical protein
VQGRWYDGDAFHLEMSDSKIAETDDRVKACLEEYARRSRREQRQERSPVAFERAAAIDARKAQMSTVERPIGGRVPLDFYWNGSTLLAARERRIASTTVS